MGYVRCLASSSGDETSRVGIASSVGNIYVTVPNESVSRRDGEMWVKAQVALELAYYYEIIVYEPTGHGVHFKVAKDQFLDILNFQKTPRQIVDGRVSVETVNVGGIRSNRYSVVVSSPDPRLHPVHVCVRDTEDEAKRMADRLKQVMSDILADAMNSKV